VPGTISAIKGQEGDRVKKGQLLIQLDAGENQANEAAAVAGVEEARRGLDEALARKRLADVTYERFQKLFNEQAVTRQEYDVKQADKELAAQGVARAEARLRQVQAGAQAAGSLSGYTRITAPISGVITVKSVGLGATVFPSQPLMTIEDEGGYQLELAIPESMSSKVRPGSEVQITLDAIAATASARIAEVVPSSDPLSRTFIAKVPLGQKGLKSGMFGRGVISLGGAVSGMMVAKSAVFERGALTSVWAVDKDGIARLRIVKTGRTVGNRVEILSGLSGGERVVVSGAEKVSEGSRVE
jgi:RND family efflux transporter MFP subunit